MTPLLFLLIQGAAPTLAPIGGQELPASGCAAYLWSHDRQLVAMAVAEPAHLRIAIDGAPADLARTSQQGTGGHGLAGTTEYRGGDVVATLDLTIAERADLEKGAMVPAGTVRVDRPGRDVVVVPVAGVIGCR